jgi:hypothetical protein
MGRRSILTLSLGTETIDLLNQISDQTGRPRGRVVEGLIAEAMKAKK